MMELYDYCGFRARRHIGSMQEYGCFCILGESFKRDLGPFLRGSGLIQGRFKADPLQTIWQFL